MGSVIAAAHNRGNDRGSNDTELINNPQLFPESSLILNILHVEFHLPVLPRVFSQDVR